MLEFYSKSSKILNKWSIIGTEDWILKELREFLDKWLMRKNYPAMRKSEISKVI